MYTADLITLLNYKGKVYLAGGWFSPEQMERLEFVRDELRRLGFDVFSPKDENLVSSDSTKDFKRVAYEGNLEAIRNASFVFCITNCKDMGTIHESGYASAMNIPIVYFAERLNGPFNLMLAQSGIHVITDRDSIARDLTNVKVLSAILTNNVVSDYDGEVE